MFIKQLTNNSMKTIKVLCFLIFITQISCKNEVVESVDETKNKIELDTTKLYQKISISYNLKGEVTKKYEVYVSKKKDSIVNQLRYFKKGVIDSSKSKFYNLNVSGNKNDSILKGKISFFSPADSIPSSQIDSRDVTLFYLQKEKDSIIYKEVKSDKNIIQFDYKDFDNLSFVGYISDLRFIKIDSLPEKLLVNRTYFAIDSEVSTNNTLIELVK
jgi:hypothetical protein